MLKPINYQGRDQIDFRILYPLSAACSSRGLEPTALSYGANGNTTCRVEALTAATTTWMYYGGYVFLPDRDKILV